MTLEFRILCVGLATYVLGGMMTTAEGEGIAEERFETRVYKSDSGSLPYRLLRPKDYDASQRYPLVVFYHGAGERGNDNVKQLVHGMNDFASDDVMAKYPCFVIAPQCPEGDQWVDTPWTADTHKMPEKPTEPMQLSLDLITSLQAEFSIDANRLYVTGLSMGGFGTWDVIQRHPNRFAAGVPICGGGDTSFAKQLAQVPIWAFHGGADSAVKPKRSRDMIEAIKEAGGSPKYTEYPGVGHNSWAATYANREMYDWLFSQQRAAEQSD
ncbi:MAG TPA: prolyl oligopeptidase family serine peptidase [Pirellulaceae bacterium]|nr:prolyl oligopeptidase family serine peptidase [Pirellulaceae bacterium]